MSEPRRARPRPRRTEVLRTDRLSPHLVRLVLGGPELADGFAPVEADSYVKVLFLTPGVQYPEPLDLEVVKAELPAEHWPRLRSYTVRAWDAQAGELTVDFVVHGDQGIAGPWAAGAQPGDVVYLQGPGGGYSPDPDASLHLLAGDESALPAIAAALERLPAEASAQVFVEVESAADEIPLARPITWVHRGERLVGEALVSAVTATDLEPGVQVFVHGEAGFVKQLRQWLKVEQHVPADRISISGYWRQGSDDEGWRAAKRDWNAEAEAAEAAALSTAGS